MTLQYFFLHFYRMTTMLSSRRSFNRWNETHFAGYIRILPAPKQLPRIFKIRKQRNSSDPPVKSRYLTSLYSLFGFLQEEEAIAALWAAGYLEKQMMTEYLSKGGGLVTIDLHHLRRRVESTIIGETIKVSISLSGEGMLDENDTNLDLFKNTEIRVLEKEFNEMYLFASDVYCHHYIPLHLGGTDKFNNLRILHKEVQQLIHLTQNETIGVLKNRLGLTELMMSKINQYREKYALGPV
ncbi:hypothetical protein SAMN04487897_11249 [Paenibacillus sp. yr247]|nr:hypothetical protein SAMN04487897_11249 [Paenibacillus sp. yr247]